MITCGQQSCLVLVVRFYLYAFRSLCVIRVGVCLASFQVFIVDFAFVIYCTYAFAPYFGVGVFSTLLRYRC
jgi:hypothetical protein